MPYLQLESEIWYQQSCFLFWSAFGPIPRSRAFMHSWRVPWRRKEMRDRWIAWAAAGSNTLLTSAHMFIQSWPGLMTWWNDKSVVYGPMGDWKQPESKIPCWGCTSFVQKCIWLMSWLAAFPSPNRLQQAQLSLRLQLEVNTIGAWWYILSLKLQALKRTRTPI